MLSKFELLGAVSAGLTNDNDVDALILFGSMSRKSDVAGAADKYSDIDLHLITPNPSRFEDHNWAKYSPGGKVLLKCVRPVIGGIRKITILLPEGDLDIVVLPRKTMKVARLLLVTGIAKRIPKIALQLNNLATIMGGGLRFLKGENAWGVFYTRVVVDMPGFRLDNRRVVQMANVAVCDLIWIQKRLKRGELVAAQRILHRFVLETNIDLLHELRTRRGDATFQQARRVEVIVSPLELQCVSVNAKIAEEELHGQVIKMYRGLRYLMSALVPDWSVDSSIEACILLG